MKKNSLAPKGLSMSQAQSISNLCNQRAIEINNKLTNVNNYSKKVPVKGKDKVLVKKKPLPPNVVGLLEEKAKLHACQGFLMENIRAKDEMLDSIRTDQPDLTAIQRPEHPKFIMAEVLPQVTEDYGWEQLTVSEVGEYFEVEAYASHIGQFIHKNQTLDTLRRELVDLPDIEWMNIKDGHKTPVEIVPHHTSEELLDLHEELAAVHRTYEQRVNYFKAKVKNLTTAENARIANVNANAEAEAEKTNEELRTQYDLEMKKYQAEVQRVRNEFEKNRQERIKETAALRINVQPRFQEVVDTFLSKLPDSQ